MHGLFYFFLFSLAFSFCSIRVNAQSNSEATLKPKPDGGYYVAKNGILRFKFHEEYNDTDGELEFKVWDSNHVDHSQDVISVNSAGDFKVQYGDNRYDWVVSALPDGFYMLQVINEKNDSWFLRFQVP